MRGLFGGDLEEVEGASLERVPLEVTRALTGAPPREAFHDGAAGGANPPALAEPWPELPASVKIVTFDLTDDGAVRFSLSLGEAPPLGSLASQRAAALDALARVASVIASLHAAETFHGDLGADAIRLLGEDHGEVAILVSTRRPSAGALLGARLRAGAPPALAAFSAPEVVTGYEATAASDVFALSALAYEIITGRAPLGQIDFDEARQGPFARLAPVVERGLAASPAQRPPAIALAGALREAAAVARGIEEPAQAGPYRSSPEARAPAPRAKSPAEASARKQQAASMSGILVVLLAVGGLFVFTGAVWLVGMTWSALEGPGRFLLLLALTSGVLVAGPALGRKGYPRSGRALLVLGVELLWADGAYLLDMAGKLERASAWSLLAAGMTALAFVLAGALDSLLLGALAAAHFALFAGVLGASLGDGSPTGPAPYALAVALTCSALAFMGHRWRRERLGAPFAVLAVILALGSALAGFPLLGKADYLAFGTAWPYAVVAVAAVAALAPIGRYAAGGAVVAGAVLTLAPSAEALIRDEQPAYLLAAIGIGFGVLGAAFTWRRLARESGTQATWVLVGVTSAALSPSLLFLVKCWDKDLLDAVASPSAIYLALVVAVSAALVGASFAFGRRAKQKATYRLLELAGLSMIFGTFTLQSLARYRDGAYPLAILAIGAACLALGATTRRATLVVVTSSALLLNLSIQFFAKLWGVFPASLLVLVFGLSLLAGGILYERRLKHLLPGLRAWS
jgi:hypothetical protein